MNLIEQLRLTPKWGEFEQWWNKYYSPEYNNGLLTYTGYEYNSYLMFDYWCDFPFEMQKGIFEKFIDKGESLAIRCIVDNEIWCTIFTDVSVSYTRFNDFEELILWYFNN